MCDKALAQAEDAIGWPPSATTIDLESRSRNRRDSIWNETIETLVGHAPRECALLLSWLRAQNPRRPDRNATKFAFSSGRRPPRWECDISVTGPMAAPATTDRFSALPTRMASRPAVGGDQISAERLRRPAARAREQTPAAPLQRNHAGLKRDPRHKFYTVRANAQEQLNIRSTDTETSGALHPE